MFRILFGSIMAALLFAIVAAQISVINDGASHHGDSILYTISVILEMAVFIGVGFRQLRRSSSNL